MTCDTLVVAGAVCVRAKRKVWPAENEVAKRYAAIAGCPPPPSTNNQQLQLQERQRQRQLS